MRRELFYLFTLTFEMKTGQWKGNGHANNFVSERKDLSSFWREEVERGLVRKFSVAVFEVRGQGGNLGLMKRVTTTTAGYWRARRAGLTGLRGLSGGIGFWINLVYGYFLRFFYLQEMVNIVFELVPLQLCIYQRFRPNFISD